jgi:hypothetical protein
MEPVLFRGYVKPLDRLLNDAVEFRSIRDLPNVRLVVLAIQSGSPVFSWLIQPRYLTVGGEILYGGSAWISAMGYRSVAQLLVLYTSFPRNVSSGGLRA